MRRQSFLENGSWEDLHDTRGDVCRFTLRDQHVRKSLPDLTGQPEPLAERLQPGPQPSP